MKAAAAINLVALLAAFSAVCVRVAVEKAVKSGAQKDRFAGALFVWIWIMSDIALIIMALSE